jgi:YggT family protein
MQLALWLVYWLITVLTWAIIISAILSWFVRADNVVVVTLNKATYPFLAPIRRVLPTFGGMDLSPLVAVLLLWVLQAFVHSLAG